MIVAVGGSATVDGGLGALEALDFDLRGADVVVACDVTTPFVDAARVFGPQKGADAAAVAELERRLERLADRYRDDAGSTSATCPARARRAVSQAGSPPTAHGSFPALRSSPTSSACATRCGTRRSSSPARAASTPPRSPERSWATSLDEARALGVPVAIVAGDAERATLPKNVECLTLVELGGSLEAALADAGRLAADAAAALSRTV